MTGTLRFSCWCACRLIVVLLLLATCTTRVHGLPNKNAVKSSLSKRKALATIISRGGSSPYPSSPYPTDDYPGDHETVQDRVDAWRQEQKAKYAEQTAEERSSPRDEKGRVKLLANVSRGSRAAIFFILMWRDVHLYEVADQAFSGLTRLLVVTPLVLLFIANMAGVVSSLTSPSHASKKRLKAILNLDKVVEFFLILHNLVRLVFAPDKNLPREIYIANTVYSVVILIQSQAFTKVNWDEMVENKAIPAEGRPHSTMSYENTSYEGAQTSYPEHQQQQTAPSHEGAQTSYPQHQQQQTAPSQQQQQWHEGADGNVPAQQSYDQ